MTPTQTPQLKTSKKKTPMAVRIGRLAALILLPFFLFLALQAPRPGIAMVLFSLIILLMVLITILS